MRDIAIQAFKWAVALSFLAATLGSECFVFSTD